MVEPAATSEGSDAAGWRTRVRTTPQQRPLVSNSEVTVMPVPITAHVSAEGHVPAADRALMDPAAPADPSTPGADPEVELRRDPAVGVRRGEYHRLPTLMRHRRRWWRPVAAVAVFAASYAVMLILLMLPLVILGELVPALAATTEFSDAHNPVDMLIMLGMIALMMPATLLASRVAYGRAGIAHSIVGRIRWGLMGRAGLVVVPLYLLINTGGSLLIDGGMLEMPTPSAAVVSAAVVIVLLVPLQAAAEEYAFRALPMQALGTWLRSPLWGIVIPVPLFVLGHDYDWVGQIDIAVFAVVAGLLAWKTGGLELPILVHAANNWTLLILAPLLPGALEQGEVAPYMLLSSTLPTVLMAAGLWRWYSRREGLRMCEPARARGCSSE